MAIRYDTRQLSVIISVLITLLLVNTICIGITDAINGEDGADIPPLSDWSYFKDLCITEHSGSNLYEYQVPITLDSTNFNFSKAKADGADIHFTNMNGNFLYHWIESWDAATEHAVIWVKIPELPGGTTTTIRMFFGNPDATDTSDGDNVFDLFDGFEGTLLNSSKWIEAGSVSLMDSLVSVVNQDSEITSKTTFGTGYAIRASGMLNDQSTDGGQSCIGFNNDIQDDDAVLIYSAYQSSEGSSVIRGFTELSGDYMSIDLDAMEGPYDHTWDILRINSSLVKFRIDNGDLFYKTDLIPTGDYPVNLYTRNNPDYLEYDWVVVRKVVDLEPMVSMTPANQNVPPIILFSAGSITVDEGDAVFGSGIITDPGDTSWTVTIDYGDGQSDTFVTNNPEFFFTHNYTSPGDYTITITVEDSFGNSAQGTIHITVTANTAPTATDDSYICMEDTPLAIPDSVLELHFDEGTGTIVYDSSGRDNDGTVYGATWTDAGISGKALLFDGNDYIQVPDSPELNPQNRITITAWILPESGWMTSLEPILPDNYGTFGVVAKLNTPEGEPVGNHQGYLLGRFRTNEKMRFWPAGDYGGPTDPPQGADNDRFVAATSNIQSDTWTHYAATYDGNILKIYVNGSFDTEFEYHGSIDTITDPLVIGRWYSNYDGYYFRGILDEIGLFPRALSAEEITTIYQSRSTSSGVLLNDVDPDGDGLFVDSYAQPSHGSLTMNPDGCFTYTPDSDFVGSDSFTYTVSDGNGETATGTVTIVVQALSLNAPPTAHDDFYSTEEDNPLIITTPGVLENDTDSDGDSLTATLNSDLTNGTLSLNPNGSFIYAPAKDLNGIDSFSYTVNDGNGGMGTATVTIMVDAVNDPPLVVDIDGVNVGEDSEVIIDVLKICTDPDGDILTVDSISQPTNGTATINGSDLVYVPERDFSGVDSFTYTVSDGNGGISTGTVTITIEAVNDPPVAVNDSYETNEDTQLIIDAPGILWNDKDTDGDTITIVLESDVSSGSLILNEDGSFAYTPTADFAGTDSFTYQANDGSVNSNIVTVTITVIQVNDPPVIDSYSFSGSNPTIDEGSAQEFLVSASDPDSDALTYTWVNDGKLVGDDSEGYTYSPGYDEAGQHSLTVMISDGTTSTSHTWVITVNDQNRPPKAVNDTYITDEDTILTTNNPGVLDNDEDLDNDPLNAVLISCPSFGTVTLEGNGSFKYDTNKDFSGTDSFTYRANDGKVDSNIATVTITVTPVNDPPVAEANGPYQAKEGDKITLTATGSTDIDGTITQYDWIIDDAGNPVYLSGKNVEHTWMDEYSGEVTLIVTDNEGLTKTDSAPVSISNVAPSITHLTAPTDPLEITRTVNVEVKFTDPGLDDIHEVSWDWGDGSSSMVTLTDDARIATGIHTYSEAGIYSISVTVSDMDGGIDSKTSENYIVIYDPDGGFVTGGGWIESPTGAYIEEPDLTGKATFGFVSKYKKGANVPTGQTEFQFRVADFNFHSTAYEWMVVAGAKAKYKGTGTINGEGEYRFMISAIDADINQDDEFTIDRFRIKIWNEDEFEKENIVYDNGLEADPDDDNALTEIGKGSIVVHKK